MFDAAAEFPILKRRIFFNHATVAPVSGRAAAALRRWAGEAETDPALHWREWAKGIGRARANAAKLAGVGVHEIALAHSTTHGLLLVARSLDWRPGDNLLLPENEFPANVYPWTNLRERGVAVRRVPFRPDGRLDPADFRKRMDRRTRLVALSLVNYASGFRAPVEAISEIARPRGILVCLDGIQGFGALPMDLPSLGCDFLSANGHKWLLSPEGFGVLYVRESALDRLDIGMTGWVGRVRPTDYSDPDQPPAAAAKRFEAGSHAMALAAAFGESTGLLLEVGLGEVWRRIEVLTARLEEGLRSRGFAIASPRGEGERSGIVAFSVPEGANPDAWAAALRERGIDVASRRGWIRAAPHFYNETAQVDELLVALGEMKSRGV